MSMKMGDKKRNPGLCLKCRIHAKKNPYKDGHHGKCIYKDCPCGMCKMYDEARNNLNIIRAYVQNIEDNPQYQDTTTHELQVKKERFCCSDNEDASEGSAKSVSLDRSQNDVTEGCDYVLNQSEDLDLFGQLDISLNLPPPFPSSELTGREHFPARDMLSLPSKKRKGNNWSSMKEGNILGKKLDESIKWDIFEDMLKLQLEEIAENTDQDAVDSMDVFDDEINVEAGANEGTSFKWKTFENESMRKLEQELEAKQKKFNKLARKKEMALSVIKKAQEVRHGREEIIVQMGDNIGVKENAIELLDIDIQSLHKAIEVENQKAENSYNIVKEGQAALDKVEDDIKSICQFNVKGVDANNNLKTAYDDLKKFLIGSIYDEERLLQCPVCTKIDSPPIYRCPAEHLVCSTCYYQVDSRCPTCKISMRDSIEMYSRFKTAELAWQDLENMKKMIADSDP